MSSRDEFKGWQDQNPPPKEIWVDHDMKRCDPQRKGARRAIYNEEYELYVIDH